jgi:phosphoglycerate kinase
MIMAKLSVRDMDCRGSKVLGRVDFNVPIQDGRVADDARIRAALDTIRMVIEKGGRVILMSHLGRPKGERVESMSLRPVADRLSELVGRKVEFADDCVGEDAEEKAGALSDGEILLLENLRFHQGETKNDVEFSESLAVLGEMYFNDAFGTAHRAHASTYGVPRLMNKAYAGLLMEKELKFLKDELESPSRPYVAILGGAKVSDKIALIENLSRRVDHILIGGAMAFPFLKSQGYSVGKSLAADEDTGVAGKLLSEFSSLILPRDVVVAAGPESAENKQTVPVDAIPDEMMGLDIGSETAEDFARKIRDAKTVVWNGPVGMFEVDAFSSGTIATATAAKEARDRGALTVAGGGDTAAAIRKFELEMGFTHISTGGGASLALLSGEELPGVEILTDA